MLTSPFPSEDGRRAAQRLFGSGATAPRRARAFVRCQLGRWEMPHLADTAELLVSELVTNAIHATNTAAGPPVASSMFPVALRTVALRLRVSRGPRRLVIEVWDGGEGEPVPARGGALDERGRGLALVENLAERWGHFNAPDRGKIVWCELSVSRPAPLPSPGVRDPEEPGPEEPGPGAPGPRRGPVRPAATTATTATDAVPETAAAGRMADPVAAPPPTGNREEGETPGALPRRVRSRPRAERAEGPDAATLLRVLEGLRALE
ncbi:hypothetical protein GCM10009530_21370 [Microbispora corallina]|uniref:Histidine kinase/HSP90-like ATPase domain-containing protein n=1 Tax=Microbispora corallina TaxID=83302 RepID=A0ABQ4G600_9ACTN|nr:ATP-binding protein [Microbispora corallina]GIH42479.1 hypothetical protein Mco01_54790 [Microbispora corallina]